MSQRPQLFVVMAACLSSSIVPVWSQSRLPGGNRQDAVEALSSERHKPRRQEWRNVAESMFNFRPLSRNRTFVASAYVAQNLPDKAQPPTAKVPGKVEVSIQEWRVPTPDHFRTIRLPLQTAPSGIQTEENLLGRLDPQHRSDKEFPMTTPQLGPHGLVADKDGDIWFTASFKVHRKARPKTGEITNIPCPTQSRAIRTRRSSIRRGRFGSRCKPATSSAG